MTNRSEEEKQKVWEKISKFPGVFEPGSNLDKLILDKRRYFQETDPDKTFKIRFDSELAEHGVISSRLLQTERQSVPKEWLEEPKIGLMFDAHTWVEIDYRVRWCRSILEEHKLSGIDETIWQTNELENFSFFTETAPEEVRSELKARSTFDCILSHGALFHTPVWYAAKILAHLRRIEQVWEHGPEKVDFFLLMSLAREWMLFGETWAEAKSVINSGRDAVRGKKTIRAAKQGAAERTRTMSETTTRLVHEMQKILRQKPDGSIKWAALTAFQRGHGTSSLANRAAWYRWQKNQS